VLALHLDGVDRSHTRRDEFAVGATAAERTLERSPPVAVGGEARDERQEGAILRTPGIPEQRRRVVRHDDGHRHADGQTAEVAWQNANNREEMTLQFDLLSDRVAGRSEIADRRRVPEHGDRCPVAIVGGRQQPTGRRAHTQHRKQPAVHRIE